MEAILASQSGLTVSLTSGMPFEGRYVTSLHNIELDSLSLCLCCTGTMCTSEIRVFSAMPAGAIWVAVLTAAPYWTLRALGLPKAVGLVCTRLVLVICFSLL